jgi:hypothetical protein
MELSEKEEAYRSLFIRHRETVNVDYEFTIDENGEANFIQPFTNMQPLDEGVYIDNNNNDCEVGRNLSDVIAYIKRIVK